ncbi:MAG: T9SS type A sorting domain-containing protein [Ignavibacteria bacterium]|nr:T9SS type A sorting domain-containing protein [Ignavibacteria bacterium]
MRKITLFLLVLFFVLPLLAVNADTKKGTGTGSNTDSSSVPDAYGYRWKDNNDAGGPAYNFRDTTSGPSANWQRVTGLSDDNNVGPFQLGFNFRYYYYNVSRIRIGSNGYLLLESGSDVNTSPLNSGFPTIPLPTVPNNYIAAYGADLIFGVAAQPGKCYIYRNNIDSCIISYYDVPLWQQAAPGYNGSHTFQIILTKTDSSVTMMYKNVSGTLQPPASGNTLVIGIENITGNVGLQRYSGAPPTPITNNMALKFYYPRSTTFTVKDAAVSWVDNVTTGGIFKRTGDTLNVSTRIANTGNVPTGGTFISSLAIKNSSNVVIHTDSVTVPALNSERDTLMTFTKKFIPSAAGRYTITVTTFLTGDAVPSNDIKNLEMNVVTRNSPWYTLAYDNGTNTGGISWAGGTGAIAMYFVPPVYPARIDTLRYFIAANTSAVTFIAKIYKDDGAGGLPGTQLYASSPITPTVGAFNAVVVPGAITVTSGGFYVSWVMNGLNIQIGEDISAPISNRSFEGFEPAYAPYRNGSTNDPMIRAVIKNPLVGVVNTNTEIPDKFSLSQNYPNPFNPVTVINFSVPVNSSVKLSVFDILGREVKQLVNNNLTAGNYSVDFDASALPSGVYFYTITANGFTDTKRMLLVK